jgi:hypothetical protein
MATRYIDKETGATTSTAIANDTAGTRKIKDLPDAVGIVFDKVDKTFKYNDTGTIRSFGAINQFASTTVTGATTLTAADSGKTIFLNAAGGGQVDLPALAAGLHFRFINIVEATTAWTIVTASAANNIIGHVYEQSGGVGDTELSGADTITFVANTSNVGDSVDLWCNGTNWFARCFGSAAGGITITTAA